MSRTLNRVQLIGRLGADPQMRYTQSGTPVVTFSLATNRQWQGKDGLSHDETDWHNIVAWDRLGQICSDHLSRGRLVYIEGRLQNRSWESEGQTRTRTEIIASDMLILDSRNASGAASEEAAAPQAVEAKAMPAVSTRGRAAEPSVERRPVLVEVEDDPDELPF